MTKFDEELQRRFEQVYCEKLWGGNSYSGPGSDPQNPMAIGAIDALRHVIELYSISSIADIPCGDMAFILPILTDYPLVSYVGYDIALPLIERNRISFPNLRFEHFDIVSETPLFSDLVFCKELLIHLRDEHIFKALSNIKNSGARFFMASNSFGVKNADLANNFGGHARPIDLVQGPYNLGPPIWNNTFYGLWRSENLCVIK